jgi:hypothetical protein
MRFKRQRGLGNRTVKPVTGMTEAVFESCMSFNTRLYDAAVEAFTQAEVSEHFRAVFGLDYEIAMALERQLFRETRGKYTPEDIQAKLPGNTWLMYVTSVGSQMNDPGRLTEGDHQTLVAEARRLEERRKNLPERRA